MGQHPILIISDANGESRQVEVRLGGGRPFVIGSNADADLVLDNPTIGAPQCRFVEQGERVIVENLDEEWGTFWNDARIDGPVAISHGDRIEMGDLSVEIRIGQAAVADTPPDSDPVTPPAAPAPAQPPATSPPAPARSETGTRSSRSTRTGRSYSWRPANRPTAPTPTSTPEPPAPEPVTEPVVKEPAATIEPPTPPTEEPAVPDPPASTNGSQPVLQRAAAHVEATCPDAVASLPDGRLDVLLTTALRRAADFGLPTDDHIVTLVECMVLLNDELEGPDCPTPDVWFAMTNESKPAEARLERSIKIARKTWTRRTSPPPAAAPTLAAPNATEPPPAPPNLAPVPERTEPPAIETIPSTPATPEPVVTTPPTSTSENWHLLEPRAASSGPRLFEHQGRWPRIDRDADVACTATICGDVTIEAGARLHHNVTIVASEHPITIGRGSVIAEGAVVRAGAQHPTRIAQRVSIGVRAIVSGATLGDGVSMDVGASVLDGASLGDGVQVQVSAVVAPNASVAAGTIIPPLHVASGSPAQVTPASATAPLPATPPPPNSTHAADRALDPADVAAR